MTMQAAPNVCTSCACTGAEYLLQGKRYCKHCWPYVWSAFTHGQTFDGPPPRHAELAGQRPITYRPAEGACVTCGYRGAAFRLDGVPYCSRHIRTAFATYTRPDARTAAPAGRPWRANVVWAAIGAAIVLGIGRLLAGKRQKVDG